MSTTREVAWGDALAVETFHTQGGLRAAVAAIIAEVGPMVGTRNTFAKLMRVRSPESLGERDKWRAWLLLAALHQEPEDWGIDNYNVPASMDTEALKESLRARVQHQDGPESTRWYDLGAPRTTLRLVDLVRVDLEADDEAA